MEALFAAQARLETLIEQAALSRRERQAVAGRSARPDRGWLEPLPYLFSQRWSHDVGPRPRSCQWLYGEGPFADADKCGAPVAVGRSYCARHATRSILVRPDLDDP